MANTYTLIGSTTATSGTSLTFSSIPQTYTDLVLYISARTTYSGGGGGVSGAISFNSNTTSYTAKGILGYAATSLAGDNTTTTTMGGVTGGFLRGIANSSWNSTSTNMYGNSTIYFPNYTSSAYKSFFLDGVVEDNTSGGSTTVNQIQMSANIWSNTAAITSITIGMEVGTFVSPSTFYLYGIKNS